MQIYVHKNNQQLGPFTEAEIKAQLAAGTITMADHVWWQGQANWLPLAQTPLGTAGGAPLPGMPSAPAPMGGGVPLATGPTSQLAIWSLVCGCLSLICGLFGAVPAIILGHLALGDIKKNPGRSGRGLALAGLIIGYVMTVLLIIVLCIYAAMLPTILKAIKAQQNGQTFLPVPSNNNSDDSTTNSDQSTNSPSATPTNSSDQSTNTPTATPSSSDSSTNTPTATPTSQ